jgi:hypothetical protein
MDTQEKIQNTTLSNLNRRPRSRETHHGVCVEDRKSEEERKEKAEEAQ